jgi:hypothetical protein
MPRAPGRTLLTRERFRELARPLIGMPISHTWRGAGSEIFLELGELTTKKRMIRGTGQVTSRWGEVMLMADRSWRVESLGAIQFGNWSDEPQVARGVASLVGHTIVDVDVEGRIPELVITLDRKRWLHTFRTHQGQPEWAIRLHDHSWLAVNRGRLIHQAPDDPKENPKTPLDT